MTSMPPQQRPALKVKLVGKEHGFYSNMMSMACPNGDSKVGGREAVVFFKKSGLPVERLKDFWKLAARTSNEYLTKDEFYVALRLIAYE
jgi:epidermal growth factor receptor substrate 15